MEVGSKDAQEKQIIWTGWFMASNFEKIPPFISVNIQQWKIQDLFTARRRRGCCKYTAMKNKGFIYSKEKYMIYLQQGKQGSVNI